MRKKYLITIWNKNGDIVAEFHKEAISPSCAIANILVNYKYEMKNEEMIQATEE